METIVAVLRVAHVGAGSVAFLAAPVAMAARKGGNMHRRAGRFYLWGMLAACALALPLSVLRPNPFLFFVALFSAYLAFSGWRALYRKRPDRGEGPSALDWAVCVLALAVGVAMIAWGAMGPRQAGLALGPMLVVFGVIGAGFAGRDLWAFRRPFDPARDRPRWFFEHLTRMLGACIATYTAVAVVNLTALPPLARWLAPTVLGTTAIAVTVARYKRQFARGRRPRDVATVKIGASDEA